MRRWCLLIRTDFNTGSLMKRGTGGGTMTAPDERSHRLLIEDAMVVRLRALREASYGDSEGHDNLPLPSPRVECQRQARWPYSISPALPCNVELTSIDNLFICSEGCGPVIVATGMTEEG